MITCILPALCVSLVQLTAREQNDVQDDDFRPVPFDTVLFSGTGAELALDEKLGSNMDVLRDNPSVSTEGNKRVPFGMVLSAAMSIPAAFVCGE